MVAVKMRIQNFVGDIDRVKQTIVFTKGCYLVSARYDFFNTSARIKFVCQDKEQSLVLIEKIKSSVGLPITGIHTNTVGLKDRKKYATATACW